MGNMSAEIKDHTRPPEIVEPYTESNYRPSPLTVKQGSMQQTDQRMVSDNTNCNNDDSPIDIISEDPTSSSGIDAFSSSCEAELEISIHVIESPYETLDRKYRQKKSSYFGENSNQSNQADSGLLRVSAEGTDSVINPGYSSIDRFRIPSPKPCETAPVKQDSAVQSVPENIPTISEIQSRTEISVPSPTLKPREINANHVLLPGKIIRVNSSDGHSSVGSSNTSVNLIQRQGSNCSDFSINTSRTRLKVLKKDRVKWGTLDHRKLEEVTPSKFVNGRFENPWDTWQEPTLGRVCRWFCSSERRNIPSQAVSAFCVRPGIQIEDQNQFFTFKVRTF